MTIPDPLSSLPEARLPRSSSSRARRRRHGQLLVPPDAEGRAAVIASLAHRAYPTYELFVYAVLCGSILGLGYVLDSQALLIFGILVAPLLSPWVGLLLATVTGSARFFFETLMALLLSALLVFAIGTLAGFASRPFQPRTFNEAFVHSRLWWPDLIVLAIGTIILTISFVRSESRPFLPSVMVAYGFFLPLSAGGFGLGSGVGDVWPHGLLVFLVYFAWAGMFGLFTLVAMRFMPTTLHGFLFSSALAFLWVVILVVLMSGGNWTPGSAQHAALPAQTPTPVSQAPAPETPTMSATPPPTSAPVTLESTLPPTETPTITMTIEPTPVYARVRVSKGGGVVLRQTPNGKAITILDNFSIVQVLPETQDVSGTAWAHVLATPNGNRLEGWVVQLYLDVMTPTPEAAPPEVPTDTPTS